jgi:hypothetical protein
MFDHYVHSPRDVSWEFHQSAACPAADFCFGMVQQRDDCVKSLHCPNAPKRDQLTQCVMALQAVFREKNGHDPLVQIWTRHILISFILSA